MTNFEYTKEFDVDSTVISEIYHNENDNTAVLNVNGNFYKYRNVNSADVAALVGAYSVGTYYNQNFKNKFGPSTALGNYWDVDEVKVPVMKGNATATTPKGLSVVKDTTAPSTEPTKEYSLKTTKATILAAAPEPDFAAGQITLTYRLNGFDEKYKFVSSKEDLDEALAELNDKVGALGMSGKVIKAVIRFE